MAARVSRALSFFLTLSKPQAVASAGACMLLIMAGDYATDYEITLVHVYILPVLILAWNAGFAWALGCAVLSSLAAILVATTVGYPYTSFGYLVFAIASTFALLVITAAIVVNLRRKHDELEIASGTDHLTGIANRRSFDRMVSLELARHRRLHGALTMLVIDCDNFKAVNDSKGHDAGDQLLRAVGATLRTNLRATDIAARLGGDEFAVMLPRTGAAEADIVARKLMMGLQVAMTAGAWPVTFSVGVATYATALPHDVLEALKAADNLMYKAKSSGRGTLQAAET
jgi:diguanylate cyclase (GGDEF)-like protein